MRVAVIGGVASTDCLLQKLHQHGFHQVRVWGYAPKDTSLVSGWADLGATCARLGYDYRPFVRVAACAPELQDFAPDVLFAVGVSQIVPRELLQVPSLGAVGFHPTALPHGRGRAPIAWLVLEGSDGAATFFVLRDGVDEGSILVQQPFAVEESDDAGTVEGKLLAAESAALDRWLPVLAGGTFEGVEQNHAEATWFGRRTAEDGWIDWRAGRADVIRLIRASTMPHPGAFTYCGDTSIKIWAAETEERPERGVIGRIVLVRDDGTFVVQCGDGLIRITKWEASDGWAPRVGAMLGYYLETEVNRLRARCRELEQRIAALEQLLVRLKPE